MDVTRLEQRAYIKIAVVLENATVGLWTPWGTMPFRTEFLPRTTAILMQTSCSSRVTYILHDA